jgi:hypothetical protein
MAEIGSKLHRENTERNDQDQSHRMVEELCQRLRFLETKISQLANRGILCFLIVCLLQLTAAHS